MGQTTQTLLPDTYYLDYFNFLLEFISKNYSNLLRKEEKKFILEFQKLPFDSQCIFVRLANRKGAYFRQSKLFYREIGNVHQALTPLHRNGYITYDKSTDIEFLLFLFTKPEIIQLSRSHKWTEYFKASQKKADIIFSILTHITPAELYQTIFDEDTIIFFESTEKVEFFKLLFFGDLYNDMTQFVIRDIGNIKLENYDDYDFTPNFRTRDEVDEYITIANSYAIFKELKELVSPLKCYQWFVDEDLIISSSKDSKQGKLYGKLIHKLGKLLEQNSFFIEALKVYEKTEITPSKERQVRILSKLNEFDKATSLAQSILESPQNPKESLFAKDFLNAGSKRIKRSTTVSLKSADEILVKKDVLKSVEQQAVEYFESRGYLAFHTENSLWRFLFGLIFWSETYDPAQNSFHHPLQRLPSDIHDESFYVKREKAIEKKLRAFRSKKSIIKTIRSTYEDKNGINNQYVYWSQDLLELSIKAIELLPLKGLKEILKMITIQVKFNSTGFPDLFVYKSKSYHFYEIKSPNDHLSAQQLFWIDFMNKHHINAVVLKVGWLK